MRSPPYPPSDPRPHIARGALAARSRAGEERVARTRLAGGLLVGLALVGAGLYIWRRPPAPSDDTSAEAISTSDSSKPLDSAIAAPLRAMDADSSSPIVVSEARVLACHDRGPTKTPADQCDHVAPIEKALASAVERTAACVPESAGGGTIEYVADVSFLRRKVSLVLPRAGRSVRDRKVLTACASAVRSAMYSVPLEGVDHQHTRYKISVTATYRHVSQG